MSNHDEDLRRLLREAAGRAKPNVRAEAKLLRDARRRRRLTAVAGATAVLVVVGGLAGATTLLGDRDGLKPAPGPEGAACKQPAYDVAVFPHDATTREELAALRDELESDDDVASIRFVSAAEAYEEFKDYYADQPELWENLPEDALPSSFRVKLVEGSDAKAALRRFRSLEHVDAVRAASDIVKARPGPECSPESGRTFARYFFEVTEADASASGTLSIDWDSKTVCLEVQTRNIDAARLVLQLPRVFPKHVDAEASSPQVLFTFFDTNDDSGSQLPPSGIHCFRHEQFGSRESALDLLRRGTPGFALTFHRGPKDGPGLVAKLTVDRPRDPVLPSCRSVQQPATTRERGLPLEVVTKQGEEVVEAVFPDGTTADLVPGGMLNPALTMPFDELVARPYPAGGPVGRMSRPGIFYAGIPAEYDANEIVDCVEGRSGEPVPVWDSTQGHAIVLRFGPWHVFIDGPLGVLEVWAKELNGEVVDGEWLALRGGGELKIGPENNPGDSPLMLDGSDRHSIRLIELWPVECGHMPGPEEAKISRTAGTYYAQFCLHDANIEVHVTSDVPEFTESVRNELRARNVELVHPLDAYTIQP